MSQEKEFSSAAVDGGQGYSPQQGGYPPQGYPQQGYPQQGGYPQQQGGYPQGGPPPGYGQAGQAQWQQPPPGPQTNYPQGGSTTVIVQQGTFQQRPNTYLAFSVVTLICFNLIFGIIALVCSVQSRDDAERGDIEEAKRKSKCALGWNVSALVLWFLLIIIVPVAWYFTAVVYIQQQRNALYG